MVDDDLGVTNVFSAGHQSLGEIDPDLSVSAMLLLKVDIESRISDVTLFLNFSNVFFLFFLLFLFLFICVFWSNFNLYFNFNILNSFLIHVICR